LLPRFRAAHTQVLGVSIDSVHCHANWGQSLGGVSFPLLADFQPRGGLASSLGVFLEGPGITDRATIIIDSEGVVRFAEAVGPAGKRDIAALAAECERIDAESSGATEELPTPTGLGGKTVLYVRNNCGASRAALAALSNCHIEIEVRNVSEKPKALKQLEQASGGGQAPCLVVGGESLLESPAIVARLASAGAPL
jgi:glutaredoxin